VLLPRTHVPSASPIRNPAHGHVALVEVLGSIIVEVLAIQISITRGGRASKHARVSL
jgi:hypothetical protein